ncbi:Beta-barrel assembly machine subunit BamD [Faunimonas pinastri]|uniref:Outer membrane protein assembly factor BamD n=1 Tax=Faunimonas pinastri TaxID=1855383 RepID=A0A1H9FRI7_9HYPH|nr:outer membrane protein assembly factor BamD [Faunimonas pinastri]SEQ40068.1 Beta-barrel assembly machine subunit BamD [Faunimonas pinastri]
MQHRSSVFSAGRVRAAVFAAPVLALLMAGCSSKPKADIDSSDSAEVLYNRGLAEMNAGDSKSATKTFNQVNDQYPYSVYARRAVVLSAATNYRRGQYQDAINDAKRYTTLYPTGEDAAYAQYLIGMSYFHQIPDVTRDQDQSKKAIDAMQLLVDKYPDSQYAVDGRKRLQIAKDQLAGKELQIGRYYEERHEYLAAVNRFKSVVTDYQSTREVEEALLRLVECYLALGIVPEAQTAAAVLGHNFPDSPWYHNAYNLLQKGGVEPKENQGSWISRSFRGKASG